MKFRRDDNGVVIPAWGSFSTSALTLNDTTYTEVDVTSAVEIMFDDDVVICENNTGDGFDLDRGVIIGVVGMNSVFVKGSDCNVLMGML